MKLKKIIILSIAFCSLMTIGKVSASIDESILSSSDFPDENFRKCIVDTFNEKEPDFVESGRTKSQVRRYLSQKTTELDCSSKGITSAEGIQYLTSLQELDLRSNNISTIDLSKNTALTHLVLRDNKLSTVDVSKNTLLEYLDLHSNKISTIDVSKNTALINLYLSNNSFSYPTETKYGLGKLTLGEKLSFKEYVKFSKKTKVSYTSSNPEIATVDENGNISGEKEGTAIITLTSKDNHGNLIYEVNEVTVTKKVVPESTTEKTEVKNTEQKSVKNPETSDKGMIYGGGLTLTIGTIIAIRKKLKLLGI